MKALRSLSFEARRHLDVVRDDPDESAARASLAALAVLGETAAIPRLARLLWPASAQRHHGARRGALVLGRIAETLTTLVLATEASELLALDRALRSELGPGDGSAIRTLQSLVATVGVASARPVLFGVAASHANGHVREAAVRALREETSGAELPFLLVRLDDWIPEIHRLAVAAVHERMGAPLASAFVAALPLLAQLDRRKRAHHTQLGRWIRGFLVGPHGRDGLLAGAVHPSRAVRREVAALLFSSSDRAEEAAALFVGDPDPVVRTLLVRAAVTNEALRRPILPAMLGDRAPRVRALALELAARTDERGAAPSLERALVDPAECVREVAQLHLARLGPPRDFQGFYRSFLQSPGSRSALLLRAALSALAAFRVSSDAALLRPLVEHPKTAVATAALRGLAALDPRAAHGLALGLLSDPRPAMARAAAGVLRGALGADDAASLLRSAELAPTPLGQRRAVELLRFLTPWQRLPHLLRAAALPAPGARAAALRELEHATRAFASWPYGPTDEERSRCNESFEATLPHLHGDLPRRLARLLSLPEPRP